MTSLRRLGRWIVRDRIVFGVCLAAAVYFAYHYGIETERPGVAYPEGWRGYFDQGAYLKMTKDLSSFDLPAADFLYGPGYPIVGVPSLWLGFDYDPYLLFNGLAVIFTVAATSVVARRVFGPTAGWLAPAALLFATPLVEYCTVPWNSTVSLVAASGLLLFSTAPRRPAWAWVLAGCLVGWGFAARYVDVFWLGALTLPPLVGLPWRRVVASAALVGCGALLFIAPVLYAHDHAFGDPFTTPYSLHLRDDGKSDEALSSYSLSQVPDAAFGMFVSPFLRGARYGGTPLLMAMFWVIAAPFAAVLAVIRGPRQCRWLIGVTTVAWLVAWVFYLSFRAVSAGAIQFGSLHYFKMWWPWIAILASGLAARAIDRTRVPSPAVGAAAVEATEA